MADLPVVFFLPGLGGDEDPKLAGFWAPFRNVLPVVPVPYPDWTELVKSGWDFAELVSNVKLQIERRLPSGPVRLAGYSVGGHIAYACARSFQQEGRAVQCVAIFDAPAQVEGLALPLSKRLRARMDRLLSFDVRGGISSIIAKSLTRDRTLPRLRELSRYRQTPLPFHLEASLHRKFQMQLVLRMFPPWWRAMSHPPMVLSVPAYLFRSEEHEQDEQDDLGWRDYFQNLTVIRVKGSHRGMLDPEINGPLRASFLEVMTTAEN